MKKKTAILSLAALALIALAAVAQAGPGFGRAYNQLTPEKQAAADKVIAKHEKKLNDLSEQYWAKRTELDALSASGKAERADIQALVAEMSKIRGQIADEHKALSAELTKETGVEFGQSSGMGPGMGRGGCPGYGGGAGPDDCPRAGGCGRY